MELYAECIICYNNKQCLKPCQACTARVCITCFLKMCSQDFDDNAVCPQCRGSIDKEEYGIPKVNMGFTQVVANALIQTSMISLSPPPAPIIDIGGNIQNPFEGMEPTERCERCGILRGDEEGEWSTDDPRFCQTCYYSTLE